MFTIGNKKSCFLFLLFGFLAFNMNAQELSKEEEKTWKDMAKEYKRNPAALKVLSEKSEGLEAELNELNSEIAQVQQENSSLKAQMNRKDARVTDLQNQMNQINMQLSEAQAALASNTKGGQSETPNSNVGMGQEMMMNGVLYRIQVGAFKKGVGEAVADATDANNLGVESTDDFEKVMIGQIRDYTKAQALRDQLRKMGVKDAFIVAYKDGARVTIKEAMGS